MGPTGHYFITTNAALDQLGMDVTYNHVRVYADTDANYEKRLGVLAGIQLLLILGGGGIVLYPILHKLLNSQGIDVINLAWEKVCQYIGGPILAAYALTIFAGGVILVIRTTHKFGLCEDLTTQDH